MQGGSKHKKPRQDKTKPQRAARGGGRSRGQPALQQREHGRQGQQPAALLQLHQQEQQRRPHQRKGPQRRQQRQQVVAEAVQPSSLLQVVGGTVESPRL